MLWEARRGYDWTVPAVWERVMQQIEEIEQHDTELRAEAARRRRESGPATDAQQGVQEGPQPE